MNIPYNPNGSFKLVRGNIITLKDSAFTSEAGKQLRHHMWIIYKIDKNLLYCYPVSSRIEKLSKHPDNFYVVQDWRFASFNKPSLVKVNCSAVVDTTKVHNIVGKLTSNDFLEMMSKASRCSTHELIEELDDEFTWIMERQ